MSESLDTSSPGALPRAALHLATPSGLQSIDVLTRRRRTVFALNVVTYAAMLWVAALVLGAGGWTWVDLVLFICFAAGTPWTVLGFWNALIGLWLLHFRTDALPEVAPFAKAGDEPTPLRIRTAIFMTVRNEDPQRAILRFRRERISAPPRPAGPVCPWDVLLCQIRKQPLCQLPPARVVAGDAEFRDNASCSAQLQPLGKGPD